MTLHEFPRLGERYWEQRLENGLLLRVVPKPGFARSYAFLGVDYGSIDTSFTRRRRSAAHRTAWRIIWSTRCSICRRTTR